MSLIWFIIKRGIHRESAVLLFFKRQVESIVKLYIISNQIIKMMQQIWSKKIVVIIEMHSEDVADDVKPIPLITQFSWNAYFGFYYSMAMDYFKMYAPFPFSKQQFHFSIASNNQAIAGAQIVSHLLQKFRINLEKPVNLVCHFRQNKRNYIQQDLRRHFKNNLKSSTALRYGKYGASRLTVQMSINNVQNMIKAFQTLNFSLFMGSENFQSQELGYRFLIAKGQRIPIRLFFQNHIIERVAPKDVQFKQFVATIFDQQIIGKLVFRLHLVNFPSLEIKIKTLQKYCHPDGYLYVFVKYEKKQNIS